MCARSSRNYASAALVYFSSCFIVRSCALGLAAGGVVWLCGSCGVRLLNVSALSADRFIPFCGEYGAVGKCSDIDGLTLVI